MAIKWKQWLMYSNILVALGAAVMLFGTSTAFGTQLNYRYSGFLATAVLITYNIHWLLSPVGNSSRVLFTYANRNLYFLFTGIAFIIALYTLSNLATKYWWYIIPSGIASFIYIAPKLPFKPFIYLRSLVKAKTFFLACVWTYSTVIIPLLISSHPITYSILFYTLCQFTLFYVVCFLFDYKDKDEDSAAGIRSFLHRYTEEEAYTFIKVLLMIAFLFNLMSCQNIPLLSTLLNCIPIALLWNTLRYSLKTTTDGWYYLFIDNTIFIAPYIILLLYGIFSSN